MNELALFAGGGGSVLAGKLLGWRTVCAVELDAVARRIMFDRQRDGSVEKFPIWDDVRTFDGNPWRDHVDVVTGGFPCQDISQCGAGAGIEGARSGLWVEMARIVREVRPRLVLVENSPMLTSRGLGRVLADLAGMGMDAEWGIVGAHHTGAPHKRDRIWILAHHQRDRCEGSVGSGSHSAARAEETERCDYWWDRWPPEPGICRVVDGVADWKHRIFALGNGQVPRVVALAWRTLDRWGR